jgi:porin
MCRESMFPIQKRILMLVGVLGIASVVNVAPGQTQEPDQPAETKDVRLPESDQPPAQPDSQEVSEEAGTPDDSQKPWWQWERATGDWAGARPWPEEHGLTFEIGYTSDFFYNTRGGLNTSDADQYRGLFDLSLTIDTEGVGLWKGGSFFFDFQQIHGRDISERHVGDMQALNNADAPDRTQLAEYWYEHSLLDGKLRFKLGKMDANADFAYVDFGGEHINSSAGVNPVVPIPTYPDGALGAAVFVEPAEWIYAAAGVYDANGLGNRTGFDTAFHGRNDSFTIAEIGLRPTFSVAGQELPGAYRVGGWYHSGDWDVFFNDLGGRRPARTHRGNAGLYVNFDQLLYRERPDVEDDEQGLGAFFQFAWAPSSYNEISQYYGFGAQYVGLIPRRDADIAGIGFYHASLSGEVQSLEARFSETAIEAFYKCQLMEFLSIKPDLQYIVNPGGNGRDAVVVGVRLEITL